MKKEEEMDGRRSILGSDPGPEEDYPYGPYCASGAVRRQRWRYTMIMITEEGPPSRPPVDQRILTIPGTKYAAQHKKVECK
ncbi:hypothetical protein CVT26_002970 [Gymnopilus dilepis]|uniref:Uncharacterized protein n=1 Tax=Gymnopilus dilepis TaxID=231916 RepID=A0A409VR21_9AGAR|nr:hypothetical protein CVT26_002970 [Gymnopilus dilepis]